MKYKLKFCNLKDIYETRTAASFGADYIGFHLISENDFKRTDTIKSCVTELRMYFPKTKSVLVTKETDIQLLVKLIDDIEFDVVQLHYEKSNDIIAKLRGYYGNQIEIIQVVTLETEKAELSSEADFYILDRSYTGGTGQENEILRIGEFLHGEDESKFILAGGISANNLSSYLRFEVGGFDIQTGIKSAYSTVQNTDYCKIQTITKMLNKQQFHKKNTISISLQGERDIIQKAVLSYIDRLHIDISDGFIGDQTDLNIITGLIKDRNMINRHIPIDIHIFSTDQISFKTIYDSLSLEDTINISIYLHINRNNFHKFNISQLNYSNLYFGLDVIDLIDEFFPWEKYIRDKILVCLQSSEHSDREENFINAHKMINYSTTNHPTVILDRGIDMAALTKIDNLKKINIVSGAYLKQDLSRRYTLLKNYFFERTQYE